MPQKCGKATLDHAILRGHIFKSQSCFTDFQNDILPYLNSMKLARQTIELGRHFNLPYISTFVLNAKRKQSLFWFLNPVVVGIRWTVETRSSRLALFSIRVFDPDLDL